MKVAIINKSDSTGGAAVVSRRLMEALRREGVDARMIVAEKLTDSPYVTPAASAWLIKLKFLAERLRIFIANGFNRSTLFKIDTGEWGLSLWRNPWVKEADVVMLNWVNQGMLSLRGVNKILKGGKKVIWTMHDMWEMTGICHHAGRCTRYMQECGDCPLLETKASGNDLSHKVLLRKMKLYSQPQKITFVAVSNWLKEKASQSNLLNKQRVEVIPNAFDLKDCKEQGSSDSPLRNASGKIRILFGAARIDDPIKGLDTLKEASRLPVFEPLKDKLELVFFGAVKNPEALSGFGIPVVHLGVLKSEEAVAKAYRESNILVSASSYETLPGTLVEAQAYGCIPVAFNQGGQADIVEDGVTGFLASYSEEMSQRAENLADVILRAVEICENPSALREMRQKMQKNVEEKFSYSAIARRYISLVQSTECRVQGISAVGGRYEV